MKRKSICVSPETKYSTAVSGPALNLIGLLAILYSVFVVYGSLVPLNYVPRPFNEALTAFQNIPFLTLGVDSRADWVANLLLFIPLAFLYNQLATYKKSGGAKHLFTLVVFVVSAGLAFGIEFAQLYFPQRTVSQNDIMAESLGGCIGIACQYTWGAKFQVWLESLWSHESSASRLQRALHVYLAVLLAFSVLPLDLTISPVELYHKWTEGRVVLTPFAGLKGSAFENIYETLTDLLVWVPAGVLWSLDSRHSVARIAAIGWLVAVVIELAQLFVYSRVTDVTDILLAGIGVAIGATLTRRGRKQIASVGQPNSALWFALWVIWAIFTLAIFWFPYDFDVSRVTVGSAQAIFSRPLLENYYFGSEYHATNEFLRKFGFFLPGGILWGIAAHQSKGVGKALSGKGGLALFLLALVIEVGQLYLPQKYADFTDVLIQTAGGWLGLVIAHWILSAYTGRGEVGHTDSSSRRQSIANQHPKAISAPSIWWPHFVMFAGLVIAVGLVTHLPFVPYNVKELIEPGISGVFSTVGLSLAIQWLINGHFLFLQRCNLMHQQMLLLPLWLIAHGVVTWLLLRLSVPMESIHDIVGAPVLGWFWEWELIGRYLALHSVISLQIIGAMVLIGIVHRKCRLEVFLSWVVWSILIAWPLHWIVVTLAATDNLTELMRGGGTFVSSTLLAFGFFLFFVAGTSISSRLARRIGYLQSFIIAGLSVFLAILCFWFGAEPMIMKYGKIFSAWQFILSPNRENYVTGFRLYLYFVVAFGMLLSVYSLVQAPIWGHMVTDRGGKSRSRDQPDREGAS